MSVRFLRYNQSSCKMSQKYVFNIIKNAEFMNAIGENEIGAELVNLNKRFIYWVLKYQTFYFASSKI